MKSKEAEEKRAWPSLNERLAVVPTEPGVSSIDLERQSEAAARDDDQKHEIEDLNPNLSS